jgi:ferredoxin
MQIDTESDQVRSARILSLELLLSDHRADCEAPCRAACPANMDVALMNRLYDGGRPQEALRLLRDTLVIPATLCYICHAPCEKICRRRETGAAVPVREIKKELAAQTELDTIRRPAANGKRIAVKGSDPMALAAAYHFCLQGYHVKVFEPAGQILLPHLPQPEKAPAGVVDLEINVMKRMGIDFVLSPEEPDAEAYHRVIAPQAKTKLPAKMILDGRSMAGAADARGFNSACSRLSDAEWKNLAGQPGANTGRSGCFYCDCDGKTACRLRQYASEYGIKNSRYAKSGAGEAFRRQRVSGAVWFEPAKCIKCGLCVYNSVNGFTFKGRGFAMEVTLPPENAPGIPEELCKLCPTGALYRRE